MFFTVDFDDTLMLAVENGLLKQAHVSPMIELLAKPQDEQRDKTKYGTLPVMDSHVNTDSSPPFIG